MQYTTAVPQRLLFTRFAILALVSTLFFLPQFAAVHADDHSMHVGHAEMSMAMDSVDPAAQAKLLADKRESEFNHHLAGFFVVLAGLLILAEQSAGFLRPLLRYAWPVCFLLSGAFVLVWSDTELWPFAEQSWRFGLTHHPEVLQHKVFAVLLLVLGVIELQRARGVLTAKWSQAAFPVIAVIGSFLLFFHDHRAGMHGPNHMELMARIRSEHFSFSVAGFGIALSKGLSETESRWRPFFERLFPTLLVVLGALLMVYVE